jgi:hypothetical protein
VLINCVHYASYTGFLPQWYFILKGFSIIYITPEPSTEVSVPSHESNWFYPAISTFAVQICYTNKFLLYWYYTNKLFSLRINFPGTLQLCTAEGEDKYETGTNVTRTTKKTPLTTFMKGEE